MAQALITRRDERFVGVELDRPVLVPGFKKSNYFTGDNKISYSEWIYPLGSETTKCTKAGYLYFCISRTPVADDNTTRIPASSTMSYELHIGDMVETYTTDRVGTSNTQRIRGVYIIPEGVTVKIKVETNVSNNYHRAFTLCCTAE